MIEGYTRNKSVLYLIAFLKAYNIKKVVVSPGTTNLEFVAGLQYDGDFELFSAVDERSAAYMACGMATECNEPIVITCTEATASRNYFPGLTEAYYRKLPIIAVTGVHSYYQIGNLVPQIIDREKGPTDAFIGKYRLPVIKDEEDEYYTQIMINKALLDLKKECGPIHIDLPFCNYQYSFDQKTLPEIQVINRYFNSNELPPIPRDGFIAILIGSHCILSDKEVSLIDDFCKKYNSVVFFDNTSGYRGDYGINAAIITCQRKSYDIFDKIRLLIHVGESNADYNMLYRLNKVKEVWRLCSDGKLRDTFKKLKNVFEMDLESFFNYYTSSSSLKSYCAVEEISDTYYSKCRFLQQKIINRVSVNSNEIPLSNIYTAYKIIPKLPYESTIHIGVSNSLRAWNYFEMDKSIFSFSNVGCRGIDGALSSCVGASVAFPERIHFCVLGDLSFFYDINALGNREIGKNLRILLINNNGGNIFKHKDSTGFRFFGEEDTGKYIAATGHFGNQSKKIVKHFAEDLGFKYLKASNKEEFEKVYIDFLSKDIDESIIFEVFTQDADERTAFDIIESLDG